MALRDGKYREVSIGIQQRVQQWMKGKQKRKRSRNVKKKLQMDNLRRRFHSDEKSRVQKKKTILEKLKVFYEKFKE